MNDIGQYWKNGMGLHSIVLEKIIEIVEKNDIKQVVEFGSGASTKFLLDLRKHLNKTFFITSFDHHPDYYFSEIHENLKVNRVDLSYCDDQSFDKMFETHEVNRQSFTNAQHEKDNFSVKNAFYTIQENDIPSNVDLVILDGPNGNGRSISFLYLKDKIVDDCFIIIDDVDHYDFINRCKQIFDVQIIVHAQHHDIHRLFNYAVLKVRRKNSDLP
jgi:hypothetical protein